MILLRRLGPEKAVLSSPGSRRARPGKDGEDAFRHGGRWWSLGTRLAYTSEHVLVAMIEYFVHLDPEDIPPDLVLVAVAAPETVSRVSGSAADGVEGEPGSRGVGGDRGLVRGGGEGGGADGAVGVGPAGGELAGESGASGFRAGGGGGVRVRFENVPVGSVSGGGLAGWLPKAESRAARITVAPGVRQDATRGQPCQRIMLL